MSAATLAALRKAKASTGSTLEETMALHLRAEGLHPEREYRFHPTRKWRFDFGFPDWKVAVEVEGLTRGDGGRHQRVDGYTRDCEKYAEAALAGWHVLRVTGPMIRSGQALQLTLRYLEKFR